MSYTFSGPNPPIDYDPGSMRQTRWDMDVWMRRCGDQLVKVDIKTGQIYKGTKSQALELIRQVKCPAYAARMLPKLHY